MAAIWERAGCLSAVLLLEIIVAAFVVPPASAAECASATYDSPTFETAKARFSPYEKVFVKIGCEGLTAGEHMVHVNWIHKRRGMIRSDKHAFSMDIAGVRVVFFWFRLSRRGPLSSAITNSDFHKENFGDWAVEAYLDNDLVGTAVFEILPEG